MIYTIIVRISTSKEILQIDLYHKLQQTIKNKWLSGVLYINTFLITFAPSLLFFLLSMLPLSVAVVYSTDLCDRRHCYVISDVPRRCGDLTDVSKPAHIFLVSPYYFITGN